MTVDVPFSTSSLMDSRRRLASRVLVDGISLSQAAREAGVSRTTARLWVDRARSEGIAQMTALSRRPSVSPRRTELSVVEQILAFRSRHPSWGARKLLAVLWPAGDAPVCERTAERILSRAGAVRPPSPSHAVVGRFERESSNELWQVDFKGLGVNPPPYKVLSVVDDRDRFLVHLSRLAAATGVLVFEALWEAFGEYGLPKAILSDNEHCFNCRYSKGPSYLEACLWRLDVDTLHGRPCHPQTQGKVERFHRTLQETVGANALRDPGQVDEALRGFRCEYNWLRPHEALRMAPPGSRYRPSERKRPERLPPSVPPEGVPTRKVDPNGRFGYRGERYQAGGGLQGQHIAIVELENELWVQYAKRNFARLSDLRI